MVNADKMLKVFKSCSTVIIHFKTTSITDILELSRMHKMVASNPNTTQFKLNYAPQILLKRVKVFQIVFHNKKH
jgi:hypothetical protein